MSLLSEVVKIDPSSSSSTRRQAAPAADGHRVEAPAAEARLIMSTGRIRELCSNTLARRAGSAHTRGQISESIHPNGDDRYPGIRGRYCRWRSSRGDISAMRRRGIEIAGCTALSVRSGSWVSSTQSGPVDGSRNEIMSPRWAMTDRGRKSGSTVNWDWDSW